MEGVGLCFHIDEERRDLLSASDAHLDLWRTAGKAFGVRRFACIDLSGQVTAIPDGSIVFDLHESLAEFEGAHPEERIVFCESPWSIPAGVERGQLGDFVHPLAPCWYVFGPNHGLEPADAGRSVWLSVNQPWTEAPTNAARNPSLYPNQVAALVLWDRWRQLHGGEA